MERLYQHGLELTMPKLLTRMFGAHADMYGLEFLPDLQQDAKGVHWLHLTIKPSAGHLSELNKAMHEQLLHAVRHLTVKEATAIDMYHAPINATTIAEAVRERILVYEKDWASLILEIERGSRETRTAVDYDIPPSREASGAITLMESPMDMDIVQQVQNALTVAPAEDLLVHTSAPAGGSIAQMMAKSYPDSVALKTAVQTMTNEVQKRALKLADEQVEAMKAGMLS